MHEALSTSATRVLLSIAIASAAACSSHDTAQQPHDDQAGASSRGGNVASGGAVGSAGSSAGVAGTKNDAGSTAVAGSSGASPTGGAASGASGLGGSAGTPAENAGAGGSGAPSASCIDGAPNTYFVDPLGDDANTGTSASAAWRSLESLNAHTFQPGDRLCLKAGGAWTGQLAPRGSGSSAAPIIVDQYGSGAKPQIAAGAQDLQAVLLSNQQYWELNNLDLSNAKSQPGDYRGISVRGKDGGALHHIVIRDSVVHDVSGVVNWIGGDSADDDPPWVEFQTGWDASKRTGGIVFEVEASTTPTWFEDVVIADNVIRDTSFAGVVFKQLEGSVGWGVRSSRTDSRFHPHKNLVIRGNYISQTKAEHGCNGLYVTGSQAVVIEGNVVQDAGTSGMEVYNADDVTIQSNEVFGTVRKAGGADYNGIDADRATTKVVVQYNYVHDNGDGILLCQIAFGDAIVRYNLVVQNSRYSVNLHSDSSATNQIYNNLFFAEGLGSASLINTSGDSSLLDAKYQIRNNILHTSRKADAARTGSGVQYGSNLFSGLPAVAGDATARTGDPSFVDSTVRPRGGAAGPALAATDGFKLRAGSPAANHGVSIADNGDRDFWGGMLYVGEPDIGPFESP